jgi:hypothetical protein
MNYHVIREGRQYGPYTLADLQRYLAQGNIQPGDLARSEGMEQWLPVEQIVGNIPVPQPPPAAVNYGQVPVYSQMPADAGQAVAAGAPLPPGLHWALVLLFAIVTCGIFTWIWMFVQATYVNKLRRNSATLLYAIGIGGMILGQIMSVVDDPGAKALGGLVVLGSVILIVVGHFSLRSALEDYYSSDEPLQLQLSGPMTFFFNTIYFQYHLSRIRTWKQTGVWS